jgi:hypothetical protein
MECTTFGKFVIGFFAWNLGVWAWTLVVHSSPTGLYWDESYASALEIAGIMMAIAYFIGVPIITGLWIADSNSRAKIARSLS